MKSLKSIIAVVLAAGVLIFSCACGKDGVKLNIEEPKNPASIDEVNPDYEETAIEPSDNVNGMRFNITPYEFTERYNRAKRILGETDIVMAGNWRVNGKPTTDDNGVNIQYLYYDDDNVNFTATVETDTGKLMNIGIGTTTSHFMTQNDSENNSDKVLRKAAMMAQAACRFEDDSVDLLQNIFYRTTTEANNSLWFKGFMFTLSTQQNKDDSKNNLLLFRVFPISDELKEEWKPVEYEVK